jgi:hypothetical protein
MIHPTARVVVDDIEYVLDLKEIDHGALHIHADLHPDGSPGKPRHHHCSMFCERVPAILIPTEQLDIDTRHFSPNPTRWEANNMVTKLRLYPEEIERVIELLEATEDEDDQPLIQYLAQKFKERLGGVERATARSEAREQARTNRADKIDLTGQE